MDIEEVAASQPEKILSLAIDPATGLQLHRYAESLVFLVCLVTPPSSCPIFCMEFSRHSMRLMPRLLKSILLW